MQHVLIDDSPSHALHKLGVWNGVEVFRQIRVNDVRVALMQQFIHLLDRILRTPLRTVAVSIRLQIRLEDRFHNQLHSGLRHPIPDGWDSKRTLPAPRLRDHDPPHGLCFVRLVVQFFPESVQPFHQSRWSSRLDGLEALLIHSRRALIGLRQHIRVDQNVFAVYLVVELIETEFRLILRLSIQFDLKFPDFIRCCQAHRQSPVLSSFTNTPEARALPSTGVTRLLRYIWPFPTPRWSAALSGDVHGSRRRDHPGPPPLTPDYLSDMLCSLPRWTDSVRYGSCDGAFPRRVLPDSFRLPRSCDGSASTLPLSRPAQALHALRPARLLAHHTWTLSRGFDPPRFQGWPPASYRI